MKRISLLLFVFMVAVSMAIAQRTVTGTVTDQTGEPLIGANVLAKGTTVGSITDLNGEFSINVPEGVNALVISYTGFETQEVSVSGVNNVSVVLVEGQLLTEVVITSLGIKKDKRALGYAVTSLNEDLIKDRPEADVARVLQGKIPGVNITATNGLSGAGTNIIIRGYSSITGSNQPLFVVDGVPFNSNTNNQASFAAGGATTSSRFLDLDPNNIENVSVLKGLSATVLYGDQGRNGVILITTKTGSTTRRTAEVSVTQSVFQVTPASLPTYGLIYGNGFQQQPGFFFSNFGPRLDEGLQINHPIASSTIASIRDAFPEFRNPDGTPILYDYRAYDDPSQVFFETGMVSNTSVQISGGTDRSSFSASAGYTSDRGFTPSNKLQKYNFGLGFNTAVSDRFNINSSFQFSRTDLESPPVNAAFGSGPNAGVPSIFAHVLYTPRSVDLGGLPFENPNDRSSVYFRGGNDIPNPLWVAQYYKETSLVNRFFNSTTLNFDISDNFLLTYRFGLDTYTEAQTQQYNKGAGTGYTQVVRDGYYQNVEISNTIWNQDLVLTYNTELSDNLKLTALVGGNSRYDVYEQVGLSSTDQLAFGLFRHTNFGQSSNRSLITGGALDFLAEERRLGVYTNVTLDYSDYLFLNLAARNDWTSTVEPDNRRIIYPSASLSFIPTEAFNMSSSTLRYLKLRVGYGTSAGFPAPYGTRNILNQNARAFERGGAIFRSHVQGTLLGNPNLRPELQQELELGVEAVMFNNKLSLDVSVYQRFTSDLITTAPIDASTGFLNTRLNIGAMRTRGLEIQATVNPISTFNGFNWNSIFNFGLYRSVITELGGGLDEVVFAGFTTLGNFAIEGQPYGIIKGEAFARDEATGLPVVLSTGNYKVDPEIQVLGDPNPAFNTSWINNFSYKGVNLNVMLEYRHRGIIHSNTVTGTLARGVTKDPVVDRELTFILPGVKEDGTPNDIQITASNYFFDGYHTGADEANVFDGSTFRIREVSLGYDIPTSALNKTPFKRGSISLSATNLYFRALNFPPNMNYDTDVLGTGVGNGLGFDFVTGPSARRVGATLNLTF
ncbi:MAG TPA: SusC/RagA family TonB-linked outer membrane protein [Saprospiraceae bacterium]|nr:SusC/RagA family TonB-linked outer membrane protein [Saprospiraceae bacterium]